MIILIYRAPDSVFDPNGIDSSIYFPPDDELEQDLYCILEMISNFFKFIEQVFSVKKMDKKGYRLIYIDTFISSK